MPTPLYDSILTELILSPELMLHQRLIANVKDLSEK